jgi:hypothetical protein
MASQRLLLGLVILAAAGTAAAQVNGTLRWRAGAVPLGLQSGASEERLPCSSYTLSCTDASTLPLYMSDTAPRSVSMQVSPAEQPSSLRLARPQGLNVSVVGKAGVYQDLGVYGRVGTTLNRTTPAFAGLASGEGGLTYGVGFSWDFSRSASASMGLDSYDIRGGLGGDMREVRTSLGLQWRY